MSEHTPLTEAEVGVSEQERNWLLTFLDLYDSDEDVNDAELFWLVAHIKAEYAERLLAVRTSTATADTGLRERVEALLADLNRGNGYGGSACGVCHGHSPSWDGHSRNCKRALPGRLREALRGDQ